MRRRCHVGKDGVQQRQLPPGACLGNVQLAGQKVAVQRRPGLTGFWFGGRVFVMNE